MNGAERIIDVSAALVLAARQQSQAAGETLTLRFVLARLLGALKRTFSNSDRSPSSRSQRQQPGALPDGVQREVHRPTQQRGQPVGDRAE